MIVSDSSVLIDVAKVRLMESVLALPYEFAVPDVMFEDELLDLGRYARDDLRTAGLRVEGLDGGGVALAFGYAERHPALSANDAFALALAKTGGGLLLSGDGALRRAAARENVEVHGHMWLSDEMERYETVSPERLLTALETWRDDPLVWLPAAELGARIGRLRRGA